MRALLVTMLAALAATACSSGEVPVGNVAPKDAAERVVFPDKCKDALTFDAECIALFDKAYGPGGGENERARLNTERAYSGSKAYRPSTAKPAPRVGTQP